MSLWLPAIGSKAPGAPLTLEEVKALRKQAARKKRRIVFHSDGMHMDPKKDRLETNVNVFPYLSGSQTDTLTYSLVHQFPVVRLYRSKVGQEWPAGTIQETYGNGPDGPAMYRKAARTFASMTRRQKREAAACYYGMITEIDQAFGELLRIVEESGQAENTLIVLTADHGECLGAHGLYMKSISGCEESYNIPLVASGPGVARGALSNARVGSIDIGPTLLELAGLPALGAPDSQSFAAALRDPAGNSSKFQVGYAENYGGRYLFTQRVVWDGPWKLVWNGFDFDELYNLDQDPYEMHNLAGDPAFEPQFRRMMQTAWRKVRDTGDDPLLRSTYPLLRLAPYGPDILDG